MYVSTKCGAVFCLIIQQRLKSMFLTIFLRSFSGPYGSAYLFLNDDFSLLSTYIRILIIKKALRVLLEVTDIG